MTIDAEFLRNYSIANQKGSEDGLLMLNIMTGGKPRLESTTEPREYRAPGEYCTESTFARDCLGAEMMGAWDAEVGRPIPDMASESYRFFKICWRPATQSGNISRISPRLFARNLIMMFRMWTFTVPSDNSRR